MRDAMLAAGPAALVKTVDLLRRYGRDGEDDAQASFGARWMDMCLPSYWEEPVLGDELLEVLRPKT